MASPLASLFVVLGLNGDQFLRNLRRTQRETARATKMIKDAFASIKMTAATLSVAIVSGAATKAMMDYNSQIEQGAIAFEILLGSAAKANKFMQDLADFAAKTPFQFNDVQNAAKKLLAFQFQAKEVLPMLQAIGDAAAMNGMSPDIIDGIVTALGQMKAKGKASAEELNQLAERNIPASAILQKELGLTGEQVANIGDQAISVDRVIAALLRGMNKTYSGTMDKMSQTISGLFSTLKDNIMMLGESVFAGPFERLRESLKSLTETLSDVVDTVRAGGIKEAFEKFFPKDLQQPFLVSMGLIKDIFVNIGGTISNVLSALKPLILTLTPLFLGFVDVLAKMAHWLSEVKPLVIAVTAALFGLYAVEKTIAIVLALNKALEALFLVLSKNWVVLVIAVLLALALSIDAVQQKINALFKSITDNIKLPGVENKPMDDYTNSTDDAKKKTDELNKSLKKNVQSFDELYQIESDAAAQIGNTIPNTGTEKPEDKTTPITLPDPTDLEDKFRNITMPPITWGGILPDPTPLLDGFIRAVQRAQEMIVASYANINTGINNMMLSVSDAMSMAAANAVSAWSVIEYTIVDAIGRILESAQTGFSAMNTNIQASSQGMQENIQTSIDTVETSLSSSWESIKNYSSVAWEFIRSGVFSAWEVIKTDTATAWDNIKNSVNTAWESIKTTSVTAYEAIKSGATTAWEILKTNTQIAYETIKTRTNTAWESMKTTAGAAYETIKSGAIAAWETLKSNTVTIFASIKSNVIAVFDSMVSKAKAAWEKIKSYFGGGSGGSGGSGSNVVQFPFRQTETGTVYDPSKLPGAAILPTGGFMPGIPAGGLISIPALAEGGIVSSDTLAMIGEGINKEAVVPLDSNGGIIDYGRIEAAFMNAMQTLNVTAKIDTSLSNMTQLTRALQPAMANESARRGG